MTDPTAPSLTLGETTTNANPVYVAKLEQSVKYLEAKLSKVKADLQEKDDIIN